LITAFLEEQGIEYEVVEHRRTTTATAESRATGVPADQVAKTIALRDESTFRLAVIPASQRLDLHKARHALGAGESLRLATEDEMKSELDVVDVASEELVTPAVLAVSHCLRHHRRRVRLVMNEELKEDFAELVEDDGAHARR
jgi:hypothetical protein